MNCLPTVVGMSKNSRIQHQQARAQAVKDLDLLGVFAEEMEANKNRASRKGIKNTSTKIHMMLVGKEYELPSNRSSILDFDPFCNNAIGKARGIQYTVAEAGKISALQDKLRQWNRDQHR